MEAMFPQDSSFLYGKLYAMLRLKRFAMRTIWSGLRRRVFLKIMFFSVPLTITATVLFITVALPTSVRPDCIQ